MTYEPIDAAEFGRIRRALGMNQGQLADALQIARTYCNELENAKRPISTHISMLMEALESGWIWQPRRKRRRRKIVATQT